MEHPPGPELDAATATWASVPSMASETVSMGGDSLARKAARSSSAALALRDLIEGRWRAHGPRGALEALFAASTVGSADGGGHRSLSASAAAAASSDTKRIAALQRWWASLLQRGSVSLDEYTEAQSVLLSLTRAAATHASPRGPTGRSPEPGALALVQGGGGARGDGNELVVWSEHSNPFLEPLLATLLQTSPESAFAPHRAAQSLEQARRAVVGIAQTYGPTDGRLHVPLQILLAQAGTLLARLTSSRTTVLRTIASTASVHGPQLGTAFAPPLQSVADACVLPGLQSLAWPPHWGDSAQWLVPLTLSPADNARCVTKQPQVDDEAGISAQPARLLGAAARGYAALVDAVQRVRAMEDALHAVLDGLALVEDMAFVATHHLSAAARAPAGGSAPPSPSSAGRWSASTSVVLDADPAGPRPRPWASRSPGGRAYHHVESRLRESTALHRSRKALRAEQIRMVRRTSRQKVAWREETGQNIPRALQGCSHSAWAADVAEHKTWWRSSPLTAHYLAVVLRITEPIARWRVGEDGAPSEGAGAGSELYSAQYQDSARDSGGEDTLHSLAGEEVKSKAQGGGTGDDGDPFDEPLSPRARRAARLREMSERGASVAEVFSHVQRDPALLASVLAATGTKHRARLADTLALQVYQGRTDPAGMLALAWCTAALQLHRGVEMGVSSEATDYLRTPAEHAALEAALRAIQGTVAGLKEEEEDYDLGFLAEHSLSQGDLLGGAQSQQSDLQLLVRAAARGPALASLRVTVAKALAVCIHARLCGETSQALDTETEPTESALPRPDAAAKLAQLSEDTRGTLACAEALVMALERVHESPQFPRLLCSLLRIARAVAGPQGPSRLLWGVVVDEMLAVSHVDVAHALGLVGVRGQGPAAQAAVHHAAGLAFRAARAADYGAELASPSAQLFEADAGARTMLQRVAAVCRALSTAVSHLFGPAWDPAQRHPPPSGIASSALKARRRRVAPVSASLLDRLLSLPHLLPTASAQQTPAPTSTAEGAVAAMLDQLGSASQTNGGTLRRASAILEAANGPAPRVREEVAGESRPESVGADASGAWTAPAWDMPQGVHVPLPLLRSGVTLATRAMQGSSEATQSAFRVISGVGSQLHDAASRAVDWQSSRFASRLRVYDLLLLWDCIAASLARKHEQWEDDMAMQATTKGSAREFPSDLRALRSALRTTRPWIAGLAVRANHHGRGPSRRGQRAAWSPKREKYREGIVDAWHKSLRSRDASDRGSRSSDDSDDSDDSEYDAWEESKHDFDDSVLDDAPEPKEAKEFLVHIGHDGQARNFHDRPLQGASRITRRAPESPESPRSRRDSAEGTRGPLSPRASEPVREHRGAPHRGPVVVCLRGSSRGCWVCVLENEAGAGSAVAAGLKRMRANMKRLERDRSVAFARPREVAAALGEAVEDSEQPISGALRKQVAKAVNGESDPLRGWYSLFTGLQREEDVEWLQSTPGCLVKDVKERAQPLVGRAASGVPAGPMTPTHWEARGEVLAALDRVAHMLLRGQRRPSRAQDAAAASRDWHQGSDEAAAMEEEEAVGEAVRSTRPDLQQHAETLGLLAGTLVSADAAIRLTHARADALEREVGTLHKQLEGAVGYLLRMLRNLGVPVGDRCPPPQAPQSEAAGPISPHAPRPRRAASRKQGGGPRRATAQNQLSVLSPTKLASSPRHGRRRASDSQAERARQVPQLASLQLQPFSADEPYTPGDQARGTDLVVVAEPASVGPESYGSRALPGGGQLDGAMSAAPSARVQPGSSDDALWAELAQWEDLSGASGDEEDGPGSNGDEAASSLVPQPSEAEDVAPSVPTLAAVHAAPARADVAQAPASGTGLQAPPGTPVPQQPSTPLAGPATPSLQRAPSVDSERSAPRSVASSAVSSRRGGSVLRKGGGIRDGKVAAGSPKPRATVEVQRVPERDQESGQPPAPVASAAPAAEEAAPVLPSGEADAPPGPAPRDSDVPAEPAAAASDAAPSPEDPSGPAKPVNQSPQAATDAAQQGSDTSPTDETDTAVLAPADTAAEAPISKSEPMSDEGSGAAAPKPARPQGERTGTASASGVGTGTGPAGNEQREGSPVTVSKDDMDDTGLGWFIEKSPTEASQSSVGVPASLAPSRANGAASPQSVSRASQASYQEDGEWPYYDVDYVEC